MRAVLPRVLAEREDAVIKDMILAQLDTLGFDKGEVLNALQKNAHNNTTASYYLLYSKLMRIMKDQSGGSKASSSAGAGVGAPVPQHKRLDEPTQSRPSPTHASQAAGKKVGSVDAMAVISGGTGQPQNSSSKEASTNENSSSARRHSTQPSSSSPHHSNKETITRAATPSGASPRHPLSHYAQQQQQQQPGISTPTAAPSSSQPRRPSSVRSGRNLVLLSNGGNHQPLASAVPPSGVGVIPVPPRRPSGSIIMKPSGTTHSHGAAAGSTAGGSRVSVSNGMIALTPIAHHQHRTPAAALNGSHHANARRHTLEISHQTSPRSNVGAAAHPPTASRVGNTSSTGSSGDSSATVPRQRISLHPAAAAAVTSPGADHHSTKPSIPTTSHHLQLTAPCSSGPHAPQPAASLKEDDTRQPQSSSVRIHAPHSQPHPPSGARHSSHFAAII